MLNKLLSFPDLLLLTQFPKGRTVKALDSKKEKNIGLRTFENYSE